MSHSNHKPKSKDHVSAKSNIAMLVFGVFTLLYLVAIDHADWFVLQPISAGVVAVSQASDHAEKPVRADASRMNGAVVAE